MPINHWPSTKKDQAAEVEARPFCALAPSGDWHFSDDPHAAARHASQHPGRGHKKGQLVLVCSRKLTDDGNIYTVPLGWAL